MQKSYSGHCRKTQHRCFGGYCGIRRQLLLFKDTKYAKTDLIYMEARIDGQSGFEVAADLRANGYVSDIIFYTMDEADAIKGYDVEALHYLLKYKTDPQKFDRVFLKAVKRNQKREVEMISLACAGVHKNIPIDDILYFEVHNRITTVVYLVDNLYEKFEFYSSLSKIEEFLRGKGFERIHGSYLVARKYVREKNRNNIIMSDEAVLPIGRTYMSQVNRW